MLAALIAWNLGNFLFFIIAGRLLGPDEFGLVAALLAVTMVAMVPAAALQYAVARSEGARSAVESSRRGAVCDRALRRSAVIVAAAGAAAVAAIYLVPVDDLPRGALTLTVLVVLPMAPLYIALGQLQAEGRFTPFSLSTAAIGLPRPVFLLLLAAFGLGVYGALGACAAALVLAASIAVAAARHGRGGGDPGPAEWSAFRRALPPLAVGLVAIALLTNLDVVVAKLSLPSSDAGEFAAIALLGKATLVVPQAVSVLVLPRVAARRAERRDTGPLLAAAIAITFIVGGLAALVALVFHEQIIAITYGEEFTGASALLTPLVAASTLLGALIVLLNHHVGRFVNSYIWALAAVAAFQALLLVFLNGSAERIIAADIIACVAGLLVHEILMGRGPDGITSGLHRLLVSRRAS